MREPIDQHHDDTRIGHLVANVLAPGPAMDLQHRLDEETLDLSWLELM